MTESVEDELASDPELNPDAVEADENESGDDGELEPPADGEDEPRPTTSDTPTDP